MQGAGQKKKATGKKSKKPSAPAWEPSELSISSASFVGILNERDLNGDMWNKVSETLVPLSPQNMVVPMLEDLTVEKVGVKSLYGDKWIAFRVTWVDSTRDVFVDVDKFCDQLAIQLPVNPEDIPSFMMGNIGGRVHITHWKGVWQEDCENGFRDVQDAYPNMWVDIYPGHEGELDRSKRVFAKDITSEHIVDTRVTNTMPGTYSQNPVSTIKRKVPVEEASAEGFGKYTTQETQLARGWAEWSNNRWTVCIVIPVSTGNIYKANVKDRTKVSFAIWNGNYNNVGGRKNYAQWSDLLLQP